MFRCRQLRVALALAAAAPHGSRAEGHGGLPKLDTLTFCEDEDHTRRTVCLRLRFNVPCGADLEAQDVPVACKSWVSPVHHTPTEFDFRGKADLLWCRNISEAKPECSYQMPTPLQNSGGFAFCVQMKPFSTVVPDCVQGGMCGLRIPVKYDLPGLDFGVEDLDCAMLLMVYILCGYIARQLQCVHETQLALVVGLIVGYICKLWLDIQISFKNETFSFFLLPIVIFRGGFNLQKRNFFKYTLYITALGLVGTVFISGLIFFGSYYFTFESVNGTKVSLPASERARMAAALASTGSVAAPLAFLPSEFFPRLHSVVFGEWIMNNMVSIVLGTAASTSQPFLSLQCRLVWVFGHVCSSMSTGVFFGLSISIFFRKMTVLQQGIVQPVSLLFIGNYLCYIVAELLGVSSTLSLFSSAVVCGQYTKLSLSPTAQVFSEELAEYLDYCVTAFVFGYFGLSASTILGDPNQFSMELILYYIMSILISRLLVAGLLYFLVARCLDRGSRPLNARDIFIIAFAGCMRGIIAYCLIIKPMPNPDERSPLDQLLVNTVLSNVLLNCLIFGCLFPVIMKLLRLQHEGEIHGAACGAGDTFEAQLLRPILPSPRLVARMQSRTSRSRFSGSRPATSQPGLDSFSLQSRPGSLPSSSAGLKEVRLERLPARRAPHRGARDLRLVEEQHPQSSTPVGDETFSSTSAEAA